MVNNGTLPLFGVTLNLPWDFLKRWRDCTASESMPVQCMAPQVKLDPPNTSKSDTIYSTVFKKTWQLAIPHRLQEDILETSLTSRVDCFTKPLLPWTPVSVKPDEVKMRRGENQVRSMVLFRKTRKPPTKKHGETLVDPGGSWGILGLWGTFESPDSQHHHQTISHSFSEAPVGSAGEPHSSGGGAFYLAETLGPKKRTQTIH